MILLSVDKQLQLIADAISATVVAASPHMPTSSLASPNYAIWNIVIGGIVQEVTSQSDASHSAYESRFGIELISPTYYETDESGWKDNVDPVLTCILEGQSIHRSACRRGERAR